MGVLVAGPQARLSRAAPRAPAPSWAASPRPVLGPHQLHTATMHGAPRLPVLQPLSLSDSTVPSPVRPG